MARLRKFSAYQRLERPYTRISKYTKKNFVRGGFPHMKLTRFDMGTVNKKYEAVVRLNVKKGMNIRQESLESARLVSNRYLEKTLGKNFHLRLKVYPFHVLRENPLASGAGADRMSTGMAASFGKIVGLAAQVRAGESLFVVYVDKANKKFGKEALTRCRNKLPCSCQVLEVALK